MEYEKCCGAVIYKAGPLYLVVQENQGHWALVKGHVEPDEDESATARREIIEETGIDVRFHDDFKKSISYKCAEDAHKTVVFFLAEFVSEDRSRIIHHPKDYAWLNYEAALERLTHQNSRGVLAAAHKHLNP